MDSNGRHRDVTLKKFLTSSFSHMKSSTAEMLCEALGKKFDEDEEVGELEQQRRMHLQKVLKAKDWPDPDGDCLSPAGPYNMSASSVFFQRSFSLHNQPYYDMRSSIDDRRPRLDAARVRNQVFCFFGGLFLGTLESAKSSILN